MPLEIQNGDRGASEAEPQSSDTFPFRLVLGDVAESGADGGFVSGIRVCNIKVPFNNGFPVSLGDDAGKLFEVDRNDSVAAKEVKFGGWVQVLEDVVEFFALDLGS